MSDTPQCNVWWDEVQCARLSEQLLIAACVHEHVDRRPACENCARALDDSFSSGLMWTCGHCAHMCPMTITSEPIPEGMTWVKDDTVIASWVSA